MFARLYRLIQVGLELADFVGNEAKCMVQRKPFGVGRILVQISPKPIQFSQNLFNLDGGIGHRTAFYLYQGGTFGTKLMPILGKKSDFKLGQQPV